MIDALRLRDIEAGRAVLVVGDAVAFVVFALVGLRSHEAALNLDVFVRTVLPLSVSWFLIAPRLGAFSHETGVPLFRTAVRVAAAWLVAGTVGLLIRSMFFERPLIASFAAVVLLGQGLILVAWRTFYAVVARASGQRHPAE